MVINSKPLHLGFFNNNTTTIFTRPGLDKVTVQDKQ